MPSKSPVLLFGAVLAGVLAMNGVSRANDPPSAPDPPPSNPLIAAGLPDPGYANVAERVQISGEFFRAGIYLGDQWFLTSNHGGDPTFVQLDGQVYNVLPPSESVVLTNPTDAGQFRELDPGAGTPIGLGSDLQLFRIGLNDHGETPEQASDEIRSLNHPDESRRLAIADSGHSAGSNVLAIGIQPSSVIGPSSTGSGNFGTNVIVSDEVIPTDQNNDGQIDGRDFDTDNHIVSFVLAGDLFQQVVEANANGVNATPFEFQARGGDSGSPVFVQNSAGDYELGGLVHAVLSLTNGRTFTTISDLGASPATYLDQIEAAFADPSYSVDGDVNLDGVVDENDLQALADGWNDTQTDAGVLTWIRGDLNQDGDTDLADFALLRNAPSAAFELADLNTALAAAGVPALVAVPEPSAALLLICAAGLSALRRRP